MAHRNRWFLPRSAPNNPRPSCSPYRRKLLMAITAWHVLFLQKDTFRARSIAFRRDHIAIRSPPADEKQGR
jgi:hypothetical protein